MFEGLWTFFIEKRSDINTSMHYVKVATVMNCDNNEKIGLAEKILILVSVLRIFPNSYLSLILGW
jgi:hypothetical protein